MDASMINNAYLKTLAPRALQQGLARLMSLASVIGFIGI